MNNLIRSSIIFCVVITLSILGCSSSKDTTEKQETPPSQTEVKTAPEQPVPKTEQPSVKKIDTVNVDVQNTQKPNYEPKETPPPPPTSLPTGKYSVQIGAYKMPDNADRIAALAKERYNMNVYTSLDPADNLYKVMIGDFNSKDEARNFRDEMARQYPSDYKGAWVSENPKK